MGEYLGGTWDLKEINHGDAALAAFVFEDLFVFVRPPRPTLSYTARRPGRGLVLSSRRRALRRLFLTLEPVAADLDGAGLVGEIGRRGFDTIVLSPHEVTAMSTRVTEEHRSELTPMSLWAYLTVEEEHTGMSLTLDTAGGRRLEFLGGTRLVRRAFDLKPEDHVVASGVHRLARLLCEGLRRQGVRLVNERSSAGNDSLVSRSWA